MDNEFDSQEVLRELDQDGMLEIADEKATVRFKRFVKK